MSSLHRGHDDLLCIVPVWVCVLPKRALSHPSKAPSLNKVTFWGMGVRATYGFGGNIVQSITLLLIHFYYEIFDMLADELEDNIYIPAPYVLDDSRLLSGQRYEWWRQSGILQEVPDLDSEPSVCILALPVPNHVILTTPSISLLTCTIGIITPTSVDGCGTRWDHTYEGV